VSKSLAVVKQSSELSFAFTLREVVALGLTPLNLSRSQGTALVDAAMAAMDITHLADRLYPRCSGGEQQRCHIARALVQLGQASPAPTLLLDEPTAAQDLKQQHMIMAHLKRLSRSQDACVVAVIHDINLVLEYCDRVVLVAEGQTRAEGTAEAVLTPGALARWWGYRGEWLRTASGKVRVH
jgi:iron complex transport system ATP-binding protein